MGQKTNRKLQVQNRKLKNMLISMADTNIAIMEFNLTLTKEKKDKEITKKLIKMSRKAKEIIESVQHNEILVDLYNSFVSGNMPLFIAFVRTVTLPKKIKHWDSSEKGYKDFLKAREQAIAKSEEELKQKRKERENIAKARAEGKNVELMYKDGKVKYVIVEEKPN